MKEEFEFELRPVGPRVERRWEERNEERSQFGDSRRRQRRLLRVFVFVDESEFGSWEEGEIFLGRWKAKEMRMSIDQSDRDYG